MLQFITHKTERHDELSGAEAVLQGGCRWIQLRMKDATREELLRTGRQLRELCTAYGATLIVDDHVDIAQQIGADGVHLGKSDMSPADARCILGENMVIGATANALEDIERATLLGADYIGLGPFRFTQTKKNLSPIIGMEGYRTIVAQCRERGILLPIVAIGGITAADITDIMESGVTGIALSGALLHADSPTQETKNIVEIINHYKK